MRGSLIDREAEPTRRNAKLGAERAQNIMEKEMLGPKGWQGATTRLRPSESTRIRYPACLRAPPGSTKESALSSAPYSRHATSMKVPSVGGLDGYATRSV
jgi:hypothetical protein